MNGAPSFQIDSCPAFVFFTSYCPPPRVRNSSIQSSVSMWVCTSTTTVMSGSSDMQTARGAARRRHPTAKPSPLSADRAARDQRRAGDQQHRHHRECRHVHVHQTRAADAHYERLVAVLVVG